MKKLLLLSSFLYFAVASPVSAASTTGTSGDTLIESGATLATGGVTCTSVPSCTDLGYKPISSCTGTTVKCPFDANYGVCIEGCGCTAWDVSKCKAGDYFDPSSMECSATDRSNTGYKVVSVDSSNVYAVNFNQLPTLYNIPAGNYSTTSAVINIIKSKHPSCNMIPYSAWDENITNIMNKFYLAYEKVSLIGSGGTKAIVLDENGLSEKNLFALDAPVKYACATKFNKTGSGSTSPGAPSVGTATNCGINQYNLIPRWTDATTLQTARTTLANLCASKQLCAVVNGFNLSGKTGTVFFSDVAIKVESEGIHNIKASGTLGDLRYDKTKSIYYVCKNASAM